MIFAAGYWNNVSPPINPACMTRGNQRLARLVPRKTSRHFGKQRTNEIKRKEEEKRRRRRIELWKIENRACTRASVILYSLKSIKYHIKSNCFYSINQILYRLFVNNFILLTCIGRQAIESSFIKIREILSINYFIHFIITNYTYIT